MAPWPRSDSGEREAILLVEVGTAYRDEQTVDSDTKGVCLAGVGFCYAIIGSGMQGTAAAYDLALFGEAEEIRLFDRDLKVAERAAERVNRLAGRAVAVGASLDATDAAAVAAALRGATACLSGVPYFLNEALARSAIEVGAHFNDLGGNTAVVRRTLLLDEAAKQRGVSVIPDCGVAPGMANSVAVFGMSKFDEPQHVRTYTGGLPQNRNLPLGYRMLFAPDGLTNEYFGRAIALREGKVVEIDTFTELEEVDFGGEIGRLQAFNTSGGTSTCPYTFEGKLESFQYKTLRYPGHFEVLKIWKDFGFIELEPIEVKGQKVVPRDVFHALVQKAWHFPDEPDLLVQRVVVTGDKDGVPHRFCMQLVDRQDEATGFTAMERTTAFSAAIVSHMQAKGETPVGAHGVETGVPAAPFVDALLARGFALELSFAPVA